MNRTSSWWRRTFALAGSLALGAALLGCDADLITYELPPEAGRYTLTVNTEGVETVWEFTSVRPAEPDALPEQPCYGPAYGLPSGMSSR